VIFSDISRIIRLFPNPPPVNPDIRLVGGSREPHGTDKTIIPSGYPICQSPKDFPADTAESGIKWSHRSPEPFGFVQVGG
jgi:hypothetical protein